MIKFRTRLVLALLSLIILVLAALGIMLGQMFKGYYLSTFNERLEKETEILAGEIRREGGVHSFDTEIIKSWSDELKVRISLADASGRLIFDSGATNHGTPVSDHQKIVKRLADTDPSTAYQESLASKFGEHYHWRMLTNQSGQADGMVVLNTKVKDLDQIYRQIWIILLFSLGASLVLLTLFGTKITNRYTKPIESATKVAIELAKGNYRARTHEIPPDEVGMLNTSINILARNLQEMMQAQEVHQNRLSTLIENIESGLLLIDDRGFIIMVNRSFKSYFRLENKRLIKKRYHEAIPHPEVLDIIEEVFMTEQNVRKQLLLPLGIERKHFEISGAPIIGTNAEWKGILIVFHDITNLKKLEQMRKDFVANVSHELKTPITSIKGFTETLLDGALEDKEALTMFLNIILKESERMESLVMDLLELSKIEQKGISLNITSLAVDEVIQEVIPSLQNRFEDKQLELSLQLEENLKITGDASRLKQVFFNLLTNAILYTQEGGRIEVRAFETGERVIVEVEDNGIGISPDELPRIFERFYRVDKARSRNSGGTGLGLAIVKHIIEAHDGEIFVKSKANEGTTFTVSLKKQREGDCFEEKNRIN
ncbi:two-component system histidine kinase PnpS [Pseudobacillus badius]|uniref:two-component system histidine kinase PnpS n=1 Tax=Bacillus badius TaxID=1455 RepID=UPI001CBC475C|nr:ATP-binding protein [Bacillus badius]UAT29820.1 PAS domain-containing protein [Bacillus badius]GLY10241.1 PAS domain-containing sensor histidine kinase [Bacillus badius]